jgi:hypothetical protein
MIHPQVEIAASRSTIHDPNGRSTRSHILTGGNLMAGLPRSADKNDVKDVRSTARYMRGLPTHPEGVASSQVNRRPSSFTTGSSAITAKRFARVGLRDSPRPRITTRFICLSVPCWASEFADTKVSIYLSGLRHWRTT